MARLDISSYLPLGNKQTVSVEGEGLSLFLVSCDGQLYAYKNQCPHRGVELNWTPNQFLESSDDFILCATHGALFQIDNGHCVSGPCQGQSLTALAIEFSENKTFVQLSEAQKT